MAERVRPMPDGGRPKELSPEQADAPIRSKQCVALLVEVRLTSLGAVGRS
jgi:hypothetical protein